MFWVWTSRWERVRELAARVLRFHRLHGSKRLAAEVVKRIQHQLISHPPIPTIAHIDTPQATQALAPTSFATPHIKANLPLSSALRFFSTPRHGTGRVSLITDHPPSAQLPEHFQKCLCQLAVLAAQRQQRLRIISRQYPIQPQHLAPYIAEAQVHLMHDLEICHLPVDSVVTQIDLFPDELLFTSSWTSTASVITNVNPKIVCYLLQEDERLLCSNDSDRATCTRIWSDQHLTLAVSEPSLLQQLQAQGLCMHAQLSATVLTKLSSPAGVTLS